MNLRLLMGLGARPWTRTRGAIRPCLWFFDTDGIWRIISITQVTSQDHCYPSFTVMSTNDLMLNWYWLESNDLWRWPSWMSNWKIPWLALTLKCHIFLYTSDEYLKSKVIVHTCHHFCMKDCLWPRSCPSCLKFVGLNLQMKESCLRTGSTTLINCVVHCTP